jgi:hypothetical protein
MKSNLKLALLAAAFCLSCSVANATTIDFATLGGSNGSPFSSYTEFGFTVTSTAGGWAVGQDFGNPPPNVFCPGCGPGILEVTGGQFTFDSVDFGNPISGAESLPYTITGFLNGFQVLSQSATANLPANTFATFDSVDPSRLLDSLFISINTTSTGDGNVDNIVLGAATTVPLPAALPLFATGIGALGLLGWRRKRKAAAAA